MKKLNITGQFQKQPFLQLASKHENIRNDVRGTLTVSWSPSLFIAPILLPFYVEWILEFTLQEHNVTRSVTKIHEGRHFKMEKKDRGYSVSQLAIASLGFGAVMIFWTIYNSYVPLIVESKLSGLTSIVLPTTVITTLTGFIMTIDNFFGLIFQPMFGRKSDKTRSKWGKRMPFLMVGIPICAVLFILIPLLARMDDLKGLLSMMAVIIVFNFVMSTWRAPCVAIMPDIVPAEYQSDGNAIVNMGSAVAIIIASVAATILGFMGFENAIAEGDYVSVFVFGAIICVLFLVILLTFVRWPDNRRETIEEKESEAGEEKHSLRNLNLPSDVKRSMFIMMFTLFFISGSNDGFGTYFTLYASKLLNMGAAQSTLIRTVAALGGVILAIPAGILGRKLGRRKSIAIGLAIVAICHAVMFLIPYIGITAVGVALSVINFVYAAAFILVNINTLPIMLAIGGKERYGEFTGYYYTATFTAAVICPTVIGFLVGVTGTYNTVQAFCFVSMIIAFIGILQVKHGDGLSEEEEKELEEAVRAAED